jgi:hypothetical protein
MIQNAALDVAIGLILMYLMLSLLCTVINEYVASKLKLRAASLATGLQAILDDPWVRERFYAQGLIASNRIAVANNDSLLGPVAKKIGKVTKDVVAAITPLSVPAPAAPAAAVAGAPPLAPAPADHPSYITSMNFVLALLGSLDTTKPVPGFKEVEQTVASMNDSNLKIALQSALTAADGSMDELRKNLATWFDDSMERLSGAYKRHLKTITAIVGVVVAIVLNADSFHVASTLWNDPDVRAQIVALAQETAKLQSPPAPAPATGAAASAPIPAPGAALAPKAAPAAASGGPTDEQKLRKAIEDANRLRILPIGWTCRREGTWPWSCFHSGKWLNIVQQILGWLLTAAALSLGAPFWFDLLSKFVNIRGTGTKPERADAKK